MLQYLFIEHPKSVCLTYYEHFKLSSYIAYRFADASVKAIIHAVIPGLFVKSSTTTICELNKILLKNRCLIIYNTNNID